MARCLLLLLAAGVAAAETSESAKPAAPLRPNIIFNLVDGGIPLDPTPLLSRWLSTPRLARLAYCS